MKKILVVSQYFYPENFRINDIAIQLVKKGFDVTVLTGLPNYPKGKYFKGFNIFRTNKDRYYEGVKIIRLPILPRGTSKLSLALNYLSFFFLGLIFAKFTNRKFDLVFTYGISPILQGAIGNTYAQRMVIKSFFYLMDFWPYSIEAVDGIKSKLIIKLIGKISRRIYLNSDKILISSLGYQEDLIKLGVDSSKILYWPQYHEDYYIPFKIDFSLTPELKPNFFNFTFTGNIGAAQGLNFFLEFIKDYQKDLVGLNCNFNFIGDGRVKSQLKDYVIKHNLEKLVTFIDAIESIRIPQLLANSKVALLIIKDNPYMNKVLPAKISSYIGCKIPILGICANPLADFIEKNQFGIATFSYEKSIIMNRIKEIVKAYEKVKVKAINTEDKFQKEKLIDQLITLFS